MKQPYGHFLSCLLLHNFCPLSSPPLCLFLFICLSFLLKDEDLTFLSPSVWFIFLLCVFFFPVTFSLKVLLTPSSAVHSFIANWPPLRAKKLYSSLCLSVCLHLRSPPFHPSSLASHPPHHHHHHIFSLTDNRVSGPIY